MTKWFPHLFCLTTLACLSGCEGSINTKLGWPTTDWHGGFWSILGFLLVSMLLAGAIKLAITTANQTSNSNDAVAGIAILFIVAAVVLQMLPSTSSGLQIIPLAPWTYAGWFSFLISAAVWLLILVSVMVAASDSPDSATVFSALLLIAMMGNLLLSFSESKESATISVVTNSMDKVDADDTPTPYRNEIEEWRSKASDLRLLLNQLLADRQRVTADISRLSDSPSYKSVKAELLGERQELTEQTEVVEAELASVELAVVRAESRIRRLARHAAIHEGSNVSDSEFETMAQIQHELEEDLRELRLRQNMKGTQ